MDAISTLSDVGTLEFAVAQVELLHDEFALLTLAKIVNQEIIDVIQDKMRAAKYSRKIIDNTYLDRIVINSDSEADIYLKSDYKTESGFDISEGREIGIRRHDIEALDEDGYLSFLLNGKRIFRKKVTHPGIVGSFIIEDTVNQKAETVQKRYHTEEEEWALSFFENTSLNN